MLIVEKADPHQAQATALLRASHALMEKLFEPEENHFLSIDDLCTPDVHFFIARKGDVVLGTGALAERDGYGEVKSMFTAPNARGQGVAAALLRQIEDQAREAGLPILRLETGDKLQGVHRLYQRRGFVIRDAFGDYPDSPASVFMEKRL